MTLSSKNIAALEALKDSAPVGRTFTEDSNGLWLGGRAFLDEFGDTVFLPLGKSRAEVGIETPLHFVGDALINLKGWGSKEAPVPNQPEVRIVVPVEGAL